MNRQVKAGAEKARKKKLKTAAVVGVTCCSAGGQLLDGQRFDIVVLDECSQMVEPLSLIPLLRAGCRRGRFSLLVLLAKLLIYVSACLQCHIGALCHPLLTMQVREG